MPREIELTITGMTCDHCVRTVTRALQSGPGVLDAKVNYTTGRARVTLEDARTPDLDSLVSLVEEEGYEAQPVLGA